MRQRKTLARVPAMGSLLRATVSRGARNSHRTTPLSPAPPGSADTRATMMGEAEGTERGGKPEETARRAAGSSVFGPSLSYTAEDGGSRGGSGVSAFVSKGPGEAEEGGNSHNGDAPRHGDETYIPTLRNRGRGRGWRLELELDLVVVQPCPWAQRS